ncbi:MAG: adenosylhomocysteinase [Patescibacteria group bacterium]|jgi:hypothetical protein
MDITKYARSQMTSFVAISDKLGQDIRRHLLHSKVLCCLHITKETGVFALELQKLGIDVSLVASNPLSTKTEVVKELERRKIKIYWSHGDQISTSSGMGTSRWKKYKIELLPIKDPDKINTSEIVSLVDRIINITQSEEYITNTEKQTKVREIEHQIDGLVYKLYGLTEEEIKIIKGS